MKFIHADTAETAARLSLAIRSAEHVFLIVYMVGCMPCSIALPEWNKLETRLGDSRGDGVVVASLNRDFLPQVPEVRGVSGFPTIQHIQNGGKTVTEYTDHGNRTVDGFAAWIKRDTGRAHGRSHRHNVGSGGARSLATYEDAPSPGLPVKSDVNALYARLREQMGNPIPRPRPRPRPRPTQKRRTSFGTKSKSRYRSRHRIRSKTNTKTKTKTKTRKTRSRTRRIP